MLQTTVYIDDEDLPKIDQIAKEKKVRRSVVIRWAIDQYLNSLFLPACTFESTMATQENQPANDLQPAQ